MANCATRARLWLRNTDGFANSSRASVQKDRVGAGVKIFLGPGDVLASLFARAAVTTGGFTAKRPDEPELCRLRRFSGRNSRERHHQGSNQAQHVREISKRGDITAT